MTDPTDGDNPQEENTPKQAKIGYWLKWIPIARKAADRHWKDAAAAWAEYEKDEQESESAKVKGTRAYPIYWGRCQLLEPAYYSRSPDLTTEIIFSINDDVSRVGSLITERLGNFFERTSNFDDVMNECVGDFIHASKATTQVVYEAALIEQLKKIDLIPQNGQFLTSDGMQYSDEVFQDEAGAYFGNSTEMGVDEDNQKIYLKSVPYDEILHTPRAKSPCEIKELAYYFCFTKEEAQEMGFSEQVMAEYPWKKQKSKRETYEDSKIESPDEYMDGYEIYCKHTKMVYWVSESYPIDFLKPPKSDPYELVGFFPSPSFAITNKPRKSLFPTPAYIHLKPTIDQLHKMYERVFNLIDSVRRRALVDGEADVVAALNAGDQEFISTKNLKSMVEKGGLENLIWYIPVKELVEAIAELNALEDRFKANFDEWFGTPDILQGQSDPIESLGAQEIKATSAHDRFKNAKKKIQALARDSLEMMIDLALKVFSDGKIAQIVGYQYMDPNDQALFPEALAMLRDDESRIIRIDIETDSMTFVDKGLKQQRLNVAIKTVMEGLNQVSQMAQVSPEYASVALQTLLMSLNEMDVGRKFQEHVKGAAEKLLEKMMQPQEPAPDVNMLKLEVEKQKIVSADQKAQLDAQVKMRDLERKEQEMLLKDRDTQIATQIEEYKVQMEVSMNERIQSFIEWSEGQRLEMERIKVALDEREKLLEEQRLKSQQEVETVRAALDSLSTKTQESAKVPPINIHVDASKAGKRIGKISSDEIGNPIVEIEEI